MSETPFTSKLWEFSQEVAREVKEQRDKGKIQKTTRRFTKPEVQLFVYKDGNVNYRTSEGHVEKEEWEDSDFFNKVVKPSSAYSEMASEITQEFGCEIGQADFSLTSFVLSVLDRALDDELTNGVLADYLATYVGDLRKSPMEYRVEVWIEGVWLEEEQFEIRNDLRIRRPKPTDLEKEAPSRQFFHWPQSMRKITPAVIELRCRAADNEEVNYEIEVILRSLRLFGLGSVYDVRTSYRPKSFIEHSYTMTSGLHFSAPYKYPIGQGDIKKLAELTEKVKELLPCSMSRIRPEEMDPLLIALQRFDDALLKPQAYEGQITSAITSLEALYLRAEEKLELSHRLGQRAAVLLGLWGEPPIKIYNTLISAYDVRSTYIHGSQPKPEVQKSIAELARNVLEYCRASLLAFLQIRTLLVKERLVSKIDNSLLDRSAYLKLKEIMVENCPVYP